MVYGRSLKTCILLKYWYCLGKHLVLPSLCRLSTASDTLIRVKFASVVTLSNTILIFRSSPRPISANFLSIQPSHSFSHMNHIKCNRFITRRRIYYCLEKQKRTSGNEKVGKRKTTSEATTKQAQCSGGIVSFLPYTMWGAVALVAAKLVPKFYSSSYMTSVSSNVLLAIQSRCKILTVKVSNQGSQYFKQNTVVNETFWNNIYWFWGTEL